MELILDIFVLLVALLALIVGTVVVMRMGDSDAAIELQEPESSSEPAVTLPEAREEWGVELDPKVTAPLRKKVISS